MRVDTWGGFVFVYLDAAAPPLLDFLDPLPTLLAPYHLDELRFRAYLTTVLPANWKAVVDAFNEGYHVQGTHPQILPWTDDVGIAYEQFGTPRALRAARRRAARARGRARGSASTTSVRRGRDPRSGLVAGLGGAFLGEERAAVEELHAAGPPPAATLLGGVPGAAHADARRARLRRVGLRRPTR